MIRAYAAHKPGGKLEAFEYDPGPLDDAQVEIDVKYCGICHSDVSMIDNAWGMSQFPLVAGHEVAGTISKVGKNVKSLKVGQKVGLGWHCKYCNECTTCHSGDQNLCASATGTIVGHHGGFANKVRAEANTVIAIPEGIPLEQAGPLFCGGITVFNPMVQFAIKPTDKVAVVGIGGLGHLAIKFLKAWGCEITAFSSCEAKKQQVIAMGAHAYINSKDSKAIEKARHSFDYIICTVNKKLDWNLYLSTLKPKGRLHFVGATLDPLDLNVFALIMGQRQVSGSPVGSPATITKMLDFVNQHKIDLEIEKFKMSDVNLAIDKVRAGQVRYRAVLEV